MYVCMFTDFDLSVNVLPKFNSKLIPIEEFDRFWVYLEVIE